jgi:hypothetical protein
LVLRVLYLLFSGRVRPGREVAGGTGAADPQPVALVEV